MPPACLRPFLPRRRCTPLLLLSLPPLLLLLSLSGQLEELLSLALPVFYRSPSLSTSPPVSLPSVPPFLVCPPNACSPAPPFLLILVSSDPSRRDRRDAIRQTWGAPAPGHLTLFTLGVPVSEGERGPLAQEAELHGDIIQAAFADTYRNLTLKTLASLSWATRACPGARFLLKTDDDVFVNVPALARDLPRRGDGAGPLYLGRVNWGVNPDRDPRSRHYVTREAYAGGRFPPYCSGSGYVLSRGASRLLLREVGGTADPRLPLEDVYVGILAQRAGVAPRHAAKMTGSMAVPHDGCCYRAMYNAHGVTPRGMREAWGMLGGGEGWCPLALLRCRTMGQLVEKGGQGVI